MDGETAYVRRFVPGVALLFALALVARTVGTAVDVLSPLLVAIALGFVVANGYGLPEWARPGANSHKLFLETGIVLLGVQLALGDLVQTGSVVVVLAAGVVLGGVVVFETLARGASGIGRRARSLLAAGTSVCGVSAIVAVAGSIDADEVDVTYAVATVLLFDALTLVIVPPLAGVMGLTDRAFGVWAGLTLFSTGPTAAVGFAVSETAGQWATVTKLVRNSFIGVLAVVYAVKYATDTGDGIAPTRIWTRFPKFLIGFVLVVLITNAGLLSSGATDLAETTGDWLFSLAFVGLGFDIELSQLRSVGARPVALVGIHLLIVGACTFAAVHLVL